MVEYVSEAGHLGFTGPDFGIGENVLPGLTAVNVSLDEIFSVLADPTRRDILRRVTVSQLTIGQIAKDYHLTFAAVSKHLKVMEKARLIIKNKVGRRQYVSAHPGALRDASQYLDQYRQLWEQRLESLDDYLTKEKG